MSCEALNPFVLLQRSCVTGGEEEEEGGVGILHRRATEIRLIELHTLHLRPQFLAACV